jgi:hypothetical protein
MTKVMRRDRSAVWLLRYTIQDGDDGFGPRWDFEKELRFPTAIEAKAFLVAERMRGKVITSHDLQYVSRKLKTKRMKPRGEGIRSVKQAKQERRFK